MNQKKKVTEENDQRNYELWDNFKLINMLVIRVPKLSEERKS